MWPLEAMMPFGGIVSVEGSGRKLECTAGRESGGGEKHKLTIFLTLPSPLFVSLSSFVTFLPIAVLEVGTATPWAVNSSCVPLCSLVLLSYVLTVN